MMRCKSLFLVFFLFTFFSGFSQQSAVYTNNLADYRRALELYNNHQYLAAQTLFDQIQDEVEDESIKANIAYYIANAAVRLGQPGANDLMEDFVERYPTSTKRNAAFLDVANYYFNNGNYSLAKRWYERVDVDNLSRKQLQEFYFNNGYAYFKSREPEKAKEFFNRVINSEEYGDQAKYYLGYMAYEGDNYEEAKDLFEEVENNEEFSEDLSYFQADMNFKQGNFQKALEQALEILPTANRREISEINKIIGESYFNLGEYEKAIPYLKEYRGERGKWNNTDYYQLGYAYFQQGDYEKAISEFNKIIDGENAVAQNAYYHLAQSYLNAGQNQQALNAFKNASEMEFDEKIQADAALNYAKLSYEIGNSYESVPQVLINYLENYPNSMARQEIQNLLIDSFISTKNYEEAMRLLEKNPSFRENGIYQKVAFYYGIDLYKEGKYQQAAEVFGKSLSEPQDPRFTALATFWEAEANFNTGNYDEALSGYLKFKEINAAPDAAVRENVDYNIGYALFKQRKYDRAIEFFRNYAESGDKDPARRQNAFLRLGDSYFVTSDYWPAMEAYQKAINLDGPENDYAAFQKAISYGFVGRNETKLQSLKEFINTYPRSPFRDDAMYELGNTHVAMNNPQDGLQAYRSLVLEVPGSKYVPEAMVKQGLIYYNSDRGEQALEKFKEVVSEYPNSPEALQAVKTARLVYIDLGRTNEYAAWVQGLDFVDVTNADLDHTTFEAAEKQFRENNAARAITSLENYLAEFPNGLHELTANYYLAQLYFRGNQKQKAIPHLQYVIQQPNNEYSEQALANLSQIYLEARNYQDAIPLLKRLEKEADFEQNVVFAQSNLMKSYHETGNNNLALQYAEKVLARSGIEEEVRNDARVIVARVAFENGNEEKAKRAYAEILKVAEGELAAEALYYDAYFKHKAGNFEASNEVVQKLAKEYSGYKLYGAKGLVLMAKNFYELGDAYQATYILENVINNFKNYPEVVAEAKRELSRIKAQEAKTNASVETNN